MLFKRTRVLWSLRIIGVAVTSIAALSACGGGSDDGAQQETVAVMDSSEQRSDYTLWTSCQTYDYRTVGGGSGENFLGTRGSDQATRMVVDIVDDAGNAVHQIFSKNGFPLSIDSTLRERRSHYAIQYPRREEDIAREQLIEQNLSNNLRITCEYTDSSGSRTQTFHFFIPLSGTRWRGAVDHFEERNRINDLVLDTTILSDLHYKIYIRHYSRFGSDSEALSAADEFLSKFLPGSKFNAVSRTRYSGLHRYSDLKAPGSLQVARFLKLRFMAKEISNGRIDTLNSLIANEYERIALQGGATCTSALICAAFFPELVESRTTNHDFSAGAAPWLHQSSDNSGSQGVLKHELSTSIGEPGYTAVLESGHDGSEPAAIRAFYQRTAIANASDAERSVLSFENVFLEGTCNDFGGCFASGLAGFFACFESANQDDLGCVIFADATDSITFGNAAGNDFQPFESSHYLIYKIPNHRANYVFDVGRMYRESLDPNGEKLAQVRSIQYGGFAGEAPNDDDRYCRDCYAEVIANSVELHIVPD